MLIARMAVRITEVTAVTHTDTAIMDMDMAIMGTGMVITATGMGQGGVSALAPIQATFTSAGVLKRPMHILDTAMTVRCTAGRTMRDVDCSGERSRERSSVTTVEIWGTTAGVGLLMAQRLGSWSGPLRRITRAGARRRLLRRLRRVTRHLRNQLRRRLLLPLRPRA